MSEERYQIAEKAQWLRLSLLVDELESYRELRKLDARDVDAWTRLLRATRSIFVVLHIVSEELSLIHFSDEELIKGKRALAKKLKFASHVRNKGVGHLNKAMSKRAVQWMPQLFTEVGEKEDKRLRLAEAHRAVLESSVNSYVDKSGAQKQFGTEIDLLYPPNQAEFFEYMESTVREALSCLYAALVNLDASIVRHNGARARELYAVAGKTEFDLESDSDLSYSEAESAKDLETALRAMEEMGVDERTVSLLRELQRRLH
jgi:hypothetical protein